MTIERNKLGFILNISLIILTLGISILGFLTYSHLNRITEKLKIETRPNINFLLYKDIMMNVSQMEDKINLYRINGDTSNMSDFQELGLHTFALIDSVQEMHYDDEQHLRILDSLESMLGRYGKVLAQLSLISREQIEETISDMESRLHTLSSKQPKVLTDTVTTTTVELPKEEVTQVKPPEEAENTQKKFLDIFKRKTKVESENKQLPTQTSTSTTVTTITKKTTLDSLEVDMNKMLSSLKYNTLRQVQQTKELELNYTSQINLMQVSILEMIELLEAREIAKSKINTLNAQELISNTKNQITIFSSLATALLIITLVILFIFTTRNKQYNYALKVAKQNAESLAHSKEHFLANMSHEIRTPINAIIGFTNQLAKAELPDPQGEQVEIIQKASTHLLSILNDILDFTKLQNEKLNLEKEQFYINQVVSTAVKILQAKADERGNKLVTKLMDMESPVNGDAYRLKQIVINIVGNSIKFTKNGEITVETSTSVLGPKRMLLELVIRDTGIGIPLDKQEKVFDEFEQASNSASSSGTGLGLSIVKKIVELHHGQISLKSQEGEGTEITIMLPYDLVPDEEVLVAGVIKAVENPNLRNLKILIADDEPFNLKLLEAILKPYTQKLVQAADGKAALAHLKTEKFDMVLLDIKMPHYSGWQVANDIRTNDGPNKHTPMIALTATVAEEAQYKGLKAGFNKLMRKPFSEIELLNAMAAELNLEIPNKESTPRVLTGELNVDALKQLGDEAFVKEMLETFLESSSKNIEELQHFFEKENLEMVSELAHKTVAPIRLLEQNELVTALKAIETLAEKGEKPPVDLVRDTVNMYDHLASGVSKYLKG